MAYIQIVEDDTSYVVIIAFANATTVTGSYTIRGLSAAALDALERDIDAAIEATEDLEPVAHA